MSQTFLTPDRFYDRPWQAGHPFGRKPSGGRRWTMLLIFVLLCSIIGAYLFITDSRRVKAMAQSELSRILGGQVIVGSAKLSIFEGLRLEHVKVLVDRKDFTDSTLFEANAFWLNYDPRLLLAGRLKVTQIVAIDPRVKLTENLDTGRWNYQRMPRPASQPARSVSTSTMPQLPEILLRNARIEYSEVQHGVYKPLGAIAIEGQLSPSSDGERYTFELQSRGGGADTKFASAMGPTVTGMLVRNTGVITAKLNGFEFGPGIWSMLPAQVRQWWERHKLAGGVDVPVLTFTPGRGGAESKFKIQTELHGVNLTVLPDEWMSRDEILTQQFAADAFDTLRKAGLGDAYVTQLEKLVEPAPIELQHVTGTFQFTEDGIVIGKTSEDAKSVIPVTGGLEDNLFRISGAIQGYSPLSPASIKVVSHKTRIPAKPRYVTSMPRQVRELYDHLRPQGDCSLEVTLDRPANGARLEVAGAINILDGNFTFDRFPYPVTRATGSIKFGPDPTNGADSVRLKLQGKGLADGPNRDALIKLTGFIGPLTADPYIEVNVRGDNVHNEPALTAAFPEEVRTALRNLDADGKGEFPTYRGGFTCKVVREIGPSSHWIIDVDIDLADGAGKMVVFPYPMKHVTGKLAIREGYVDIIDATMKKGDSSLVIGGRVTWRAGAGGRPLEPGEVAGQVTPAHPDMKVTARNIAIDKTLLEALPRDRREWLQKIGLRGTLDIDGRVWRKGETTSSAARAGESEMMHDFQLRLRDGSVWPTEGTFALSGITGQFRLTPDRLVIQKLTARRNAADLTATGEISWPDNQPHVSLAGAARELQLDSTLYQVLPAVGKKAWDAVQPQGTVDAEMSYVGALNVADSPGPAGGAPGTGAIPTTPAIPQPSFSLTIHPRALSATVQSVPYKLENIQGTVTISDGRIRLQNLSARHGTGAVKISGTGAAGDVTDWNLSLAADHLAIDDEFRKALPSSLASTLNAIKLAGTISFDMPRLIIQTAPPEHIRPATQPATTTPASAPLDVDFASRITLAGASFDLGVPMTGASGTLDLQGTVRGNHLDTLSGPVDISSMKIADREAKNIHAEFYKPAGFDALRLGQMRGELAGGEMAGGVDLAFPDLGASRYRLNLVLHHADVRELTAETDHDISGELTASLALEGDWSDIRTRRGRGDVSVSGKDMYKIPLVLGLLQITNLSLPISAPFNEGSARYSVDGQTVTFENLALRSNTMLMSGSGQLDFGTRQVRMSFTTDNPAWPHIPIVGDLLNNAKNEMLQIHVKGTLQEPKVSATAINTFTTTVDEVLRGNSRR
jgi:hypothetical protein